MRSDFLGLQRDSRGDFEGHPPLHYLDTAATALKPKAVVEGIAHYLHYESGSPNRGAHRLSVKSTQLYQASKERVKSFLGVDEDEDWHVVYTKNATESLNLIASALPKDALREGEEVAITITAHHSNILPWQRLCKERGATLVYLYVDEAGQLLPNELSKIHAKTRLVSFPYIVNATGTMHPVEELIRQAHRVGALAVVDAAQAVGHVPIDLQALDADLFVFSAHKVYAPTGIGVLIGKAEVLETFEPYMLGGDMIDYVTEQSATYAPLPQRLEAGTQNVMGAVGLMAAIDWLEAQGVAVIEQRERALGALLYEHLKARGDIELYGPTEASERGAIVSFNVKGVHSHDVASILDTHGVAIRAGHHCCQPLMSYLKIPSSCRASFGAYSHEEDVYALLRALDAVKEVFKAYVD